jgi:hypothetical protein
LERTARKRPAQRRRRSVRKTAGIEMEISRIPHPSKLRRARGAGQAQPPRLRSIRRPADARRGPSLARTGGPRGRTGARKGDPPVPWAGEPAEPPAGLRPARATIPHWPQPVPRGILARADPGIRGPLQALPSGYV